MIKLKRAYDSPSPEDGARFLVDRLWPRGVKKEALELEGWLKHVAPSDELRRWFDHDAGKWEEFKQRYYAELDEKPQRWQPLVGAARDEDITLVYAASDTEHNNAVVLKEYLEQQLIDRG